MPEAFTSEPEKSGGLMCAVSDRARKRAVGFRAGKCFDSKVLSQSASVSALAAAASFESNNKFLSEKILDKILAISPNGNVNGRDFGKLVALRNVTSNPSRNTVASLISLISLISPARLH